MLLSRGLTVFVLLASIPAHALQIVVPDPAANGAVIPVEVRPAKPLMSGQQLDLLVNGQLAAQVRVVKGHLSAFSTRVKGSQNNTTISARVLANGGELERGAREIKVTVPVSVSGAPTAVGPMKLRNAGGKVKLLMSSENGFSGPLVLQATGFQVEISGSTSLAKNPIIGVDTDVSGDVIASLGGQTSRPGLQSTPRPTAQPVQQPTTVTPAPKAVVANRQLETARTNHDCEVEFRKFAEIEAAQFNNPRYLNLSQDGISRTKDDMFQQSFRSWMPLAPGGLRPFMQMFNDATTLRQYAKDKIESETNPRFKLQAAITSCMALKRANALSQGAISPGTTKPAAQTVTPAPKPSASGHNPCMKGSYFDGSGCRRAGDSGSGVAR